jgi:hypothetical protein
VNGQPTPRPGRSYPLIIFVAVVGSLVYAFWGLIA